MHLAVSLAALLGSVFTTATISHNSTLDKNNTIVPGAYVVEFVGGHDHISFYRSLAADGVDVSPRMNMSFKLFNGSSFSITSRIGHNSIASKIAVMSSVKRIWPMRLYPAPTAEGLHVIDTPLLNVNAHGHLSKHGNATVGGKHSDSPHLMTQVDRLHAAGYTGKGARIAIVDTGVDYHHPALGGCFGKGCLISGGYDLAGHSYDGTSAPEPAPNPYDACDGHGTHVAGIIGARPNEMGFTGVAPGAALSMYKVFSCEGGSTTDDLLISAFNMAYDDGADIITASIGGAGGWSEAPWSAVVGRIVENGVPCTLAAGNGGWDGLWAPSSAADGKGVTAVSSFDNVRSPYLWYKGSYSTNSSTVEPNSGPVSKSFGWLPGYPSFVENLTLPLYATSLNASVEDDACASLPPNTPDLSDSIVLIRMGKTCSISDQVANVSVFNARYVLFYGSSTDDLLAFYSDAFAGGSLYGMGLVLPEQGVKWVGLMDKGFDVRISIIDEFNAGLISTDTPNNLTGGFASSYTSWGPTLSLDVYPTLGAPGGNILSTYLLSQGGYKVASGTSMATPFMAAVYALVGQVRGTFDPAELGIYLSSTSRAQLWNDGSGTLNGLAPVPQQGAGLVQAYDAAFTTTHVSTKGISFNDTDNFRTATFTIRNMGSRAVTYKLGNSPALSMNTLSVESNYPQAFPNVIIGATADLDFSNTSVRIQPRGRANITVEPILAGASGLTQGLLPVYSGYITINGSNGDDLTIPYLGVHGSMYSAEVMTAYEDMADACLAGGSSPSQDRAAFTVPYPAPNGEPLVPSPDVLNMYPSVGFRLNFGTRILRADVIPLSPNYSLPLTTVLGHKIAGSVYGYPVQYRPRISEYVSFFGMLDDGTIVPEGDYGLSIRALKLFGDPEKPHDYEELAASSFTLFYQARSRETAGVRNYETAKSFYSATLPLIGLDLVYDSTAATQGTPSGDDGPRTLGYGPNADNELLNIFEYGPHASAPGPGSHIAFNTDSRAVVDQFYEAAIQHGGKSNGAPGVRPHYGKSYYAAFVIDPDGWRLEVVCRDT